MNWAAWNDVYDHLVDFEQMLRAFHEAAPGDAPEAGWLWTVERQFERLQSSMEVFASVAERGQGSACQAPELRAVALSSAPDGQGLDAS